MKKLKIREIGNSAGVILPAEELTRLRAKVGDDLFVCETPNGIELSVYDPEFAEQVEVAEEIMREDRNVLKKLAK